MLDEGGLVENLARGPLDVVVYTVTPFVRDHLFLAGDLRFAQDEPRHSLCLELHGELDAVGRNRLVIIGPVDPGRGVRLGTTLFELSVEGSRAQILGLVEHQVFEEVREPGLSWLLVARADSEPRVVAGDGRGRVDQHEHGQPVAQAPAMHHFAAERVGPFVLKSSALGRATAGLLCPAAARLRRVARPQLFHAERFVIRGILAGQDFFG